MVDAKNHTDRTETKGLYISRKVSGYSVYTSNHFSGFYTKQRKEANFPNCHKCKLSPDEIRGQQPKGN